MKPLYVYFRKKKRIYNLLYEASYKNHENKIIHRTFVILLKVWDFLFIFFPVLFLIETKISGRIEFVDHLVREPIIINPIFEMFLDNEILFSSLSLFFFVSSRIYQNAFRIYKNENVFACDFHDVNHDYRNFINDIAEWKREHSLYLNLDLPETISKDYLHFIKELCNRASQSMQKLINDAECYIVIKWLEEKSHDTYSVIHYDAFPDRAPGKHLQDQLIHRESVDKPSNLFQLIINKFNDAKKAGNPRLRDLGILANDLAGHENFNPKISKDNLTRFKSCIIIPITIDYAIQGFLCFNSNRVGILREKHRHLLSGYCDVIANLFRNVFLSLTPFQSGIAVERSLDTTTRITRIED
jgi:hypothetical protein